VNSELESVAGKRSCLYLRSCPGLCVERLMKTMKTSARTVGSRNRDSEYGPEVVLLEAILFLRVYLQYAQFIIVRRYKWATTTSILSL
jgi:hypothetical protein